MRRPRPHKLAEWLLTKLTCHSIRYSALGDLEEQFHYFAGQKSFLFAHAWYWLQVPAALRSFMSETIYWSATMVKNYFKVSYRGMLKNRMPTLINLAGLSLTIACTIVIYLFIDFIYYTDDFHINGHEIYMVESAIESDGKRELWGNSPVPLAPALRADFPQVKRAVRAARAQGTMRYADKVFREGLLFVDAEFLDMFTFPLKLGQKHALDNRNALILTEESALKYFGDVNPVGKQVSFTFEGDLRETFLVLGVLEDLPSKASFRFNMLAAFDKQADLGLNENDWSKLASATFIQMASAAEAELVAEQTQHYVALQNEADPDRPMSGFIFDPLLEVPMRGLTIKSRFTHVFFPGAPFALGLVAFLVLALASFNFVNVAIASASTRLKEIGVRKAIGGRQIQIIRQFLGESLLLFLMAFVLGVLMADALLIPGLNNLMGEGLQLSLSYVENPGLWLFYGAFLLFMGLAAGSYPAFYISRFKPTDIFQGRQTIEGRHRLRRLLLTLQYVISFFFIAYSVTFRQNAEYQRNIDWGYGEEQVLVVPLKGSAFPKFSHELTRHNAILDVAGSAHHIGKSQGRALVQVGDRKLDIVRLDVGTNYVEALKLRLVQGRSFDAELASDEESILVNKAFVLQTNMAEPVGQRLRYDNQAYRIVGVLEDFHYAGFIFPVEPLMVRLVPEKDFRYLSIRIAAGNVTQTEEFVSKTWRKLLPDEPYEAFFQDTVFDDFHRGNDLNFKMMSFLAIVALIISSMGLFGLVAFAIARRKKEISIRKVLGASVGNVIGLVNKEFLFILLVASIVAAPISYFALTAMLAAMFQYHVPVTALPLVVTAALVVLTALLTVFAQVYRGANLNPIEALRSE